MNAALTRRSVLKGMGVFALGAGMARIGLKGVSAAGSLTEINSGYSSTPTAAVSWRVVADTAQPAGTGEALERALGFVLANRGDLVITTPAGNPMLVQEGGSFFVPEGDLETQEGASGATVPYIRFGLVDPAEAYFTAGGELLFGSDVQQFAAGGEVLIRLHEGRLSSPETVPLPPTGPQGEAIYFRENADARRGEWPTGAKPDCGDRCRPADWQRPDLLRLLERNLDRSTG